MNAFVTVQDQQNNSTQIETASRLQMKYSCSWMESSYQLSCNIIYFCCYFTTRTCQQTITLPRNHRLFQMERRKKVYFMKQNLRRQRSLLTFLRQPQTQPQRRISPPKDQNHQQRHVTDIPTRLRTVWTCEHVVYM